ncbi:DUF4917 family protein [Phenylobacterium sp.]|jgi:hypothetical protein|uniref:DUF4917 family protein n=1 Tax=Phenylobacterium sp. TaxID=1871053 RepID=UPI0037835E67
MSFAQAMADTATHRRHLLLGNGFSMSIHGGFRYGSLFEEAARIDNGIVPLFAGHGADFEAAIGAASSAEDQDRIRSAFIRAISKVHPKRKYLSVEARIACGRFLEQFAGVERAELRGSVFTTNYDLLLYWVLMQRKQALKMYDGFDNYGVWSSARVWNSYVFYLHGALHLYEVPRGMVPPGMEQQKLLWREDATLIDQVRANLRTGRFPLFVSEGGPDSKLRRIGRNPYLKRVRRKFREVTKSANTSLFVVGHSLADVDSHITDVIGEGSADVYLGVFNGDDETRARRVVATWAQRRQDLGNGPLSVRLFKSAECPIWTEPTAD